MRERVTSDAGEVQRGQVQVKWKPDWRWFWRVERGSRGEVSGCVSEVYRWEIDEWTGRTGYGDFLALGNIPRCAHRVRQEFCVDDILRTDFIVSTPFHVSSSNFLQERVDLLRITRMIQPTRLRPNSQMIPTPNFHLKRIRLDNILHSDPLIPIHITQRQKLISSLLG
jgi:hypothetical protein